MAQLGCHVPAAFASVRPADRIFTRIGTGDSIETNSSSFMVEMQDTAHIAAHATSRYTYMVAQACLWSGRVWVEFCAGQDGDPILAMGACAPASSASGRLLQVQESSCLHIIKMVGGVVFCNTWSRSVCCV